MLDPTLKVIADNPALFEALQKHLLAEFDDMGGVKHTDSSQLLGEILKSRLIGNEVVKGAFKKILQLKSTSELPIKRNEAR